MCWTTVCFWDCDNTCVTPPQALTGFLQIPVFKIHFFQALPPGPQVQPVVRRSSGFHGSCTDALCVAGTLFAACELLKKLQAQILECVVIVELTELRGVDRVKPFNVFSLVQY